MYLEHIREDHDVAVFGDIGTNELGLLHVTTVASSAVGDTLAGLARHSRAAFVIIAGITGVVQGSAVGQRTIIDRTLLEPEEAAFVTVVLTESARSFGINVAKISSAVLEVTRAATRLIGGVSKNCLLCGHDSLNGVHGFFSGLKGSLFAERLKHVVSVKETGKCVVDNSTLLLNRLGKRGGVDFIESTALRSIALVVKGKVVSVFVLHERVGFIVDAPVLGTVLVFVTLRNRVAHGIHEVIVSSAGWVTQETNNVLDVRVIIWQANVGSQTSRNVTDVTRDGVRSDKGSNANTRRNKVEIDDKAVDRYNHTVISTTLTQESGLVVYVEVDRDVVEPVGPWFLLLTHRKLYLDVLLDNNSSTPREIFVKTPLSEFSAGFEVVVISFEGCLCEDVLSNTLAS